jgi:putative membrane protein
VLCVDRDNDIEEKAGIKTPIVGRDKCVDAASHLAISDPEEADANAIFGAVKQYDDLSRKKYECEVAVISGEHNTSLESDLKIRRQLKEVSSQFDPGGVVLVTDGSEDEEVIPVIQNIVPVVSVKRVVVKHSKSLEETYAVLGRYFRMLVYDSRYSRISLGIPGVFLMLSLIAILFGQERIVFLLALGLIGLTLLVRGFDIDRWFEALPRMRPSGYIRLFSSVASILIISTSLYTAFVSISTTEAFAEVQKDVNLIWNHGPFLFGMLIHESLNILWIGLAIYFAGGVMVNYLKGNIRIIGNSVGLIILGLLYLPILQFSDILMGTGSTATLISFLLIGFAVVFLTATVVYLYVQRRRGSR